jgi:hypothetical protein
MGHAVAWFGTPTADGGVLPQRRHSHVGANRGCPGSSVVDADDLDEAGGGIVQVMGAPSVL